MTLQRRTQALLDLVEDYGTQKCSAIIGEAEARSVALLRRAHGDARARMRQAFLEERARMAERVAAAQANLQTRRRIALQRHAAAMLAAGWQHLPEAMAARWRDPGARREWVAAALARARSSLPAGAWRIAHAGGWPAAERAALAAELASTLPAAPALVADPGIGAGLRISANGNVVDATQEGLLADQAEIGALLLHELEETRT